MEREGEELGPDQGTLWVMGGSFALGLKNDGSWCKGGDG